MSMGNTTNKKPGKIGGGPVLTKQAFKDEVDINKIIARFEKTGMIEAINSKQPFYGDVSDIKDYKESLEIVKEAEALFMAMSPEIRERFDHDPQEMIEFLSDNKNKKEAIELGMVLKEPVKPNNDSSNVIKGDDQATTPK